ERGGFAPDSDDSPTTGGHVWQAFSISSPRMVSAPSSTTTTVVLRPILEMSSPRSIHRDGQATYWSGGTPLVKGRVERSNLRAQFPILRLSEHVCVLSKHYEPSRERHRTMQGSVRDAAWKRGT